jgi:hypothetical protein
MSIIKEFYGHLHSFKKKQKPFEFQRLRRLTILRQVYQVLVIIVFLGENRNLLLIFLKIKQLNKINLDNSI